MLPILGIISGFFNAFFTFLTGVVGHYRLVVFWCQNAWVFSQKCMSFSPEPMICFPKHSGMIRHWSKPKRFHYVERTLSNSFAILLFSSMEITKQDLWGNSAFCFSYLYAIRLCTSTSFRNVAEKATWSMSGWQIKNYLWSWIVNLL